jgi:alkanesulfonate monooxygenase SsuD/methylene tetrahydromethanopterin reductase-like flavin-dependent oxidoreductase (luciferase family)
MAVNAEEDARMGRTSWVPHPWVSEGAGRIRCGVGVFPLAPATDGATMLRLARAVEELGFDSLWASDHPTHLPDCWTTLAAFAAVTSRVRLGPYVSCVLYRSPVQLARQAADVDRLSGGRLVLGIGTGSVEGEFPALGLAIPTLSERRRALDETIGALDRLWHGTPFRLDPATMRIDGEALPHGPVQRPRVPLLIGGSGERVTLRRVAEHADACNLGSGPHRSVEDVRRQLGALRDHCAAVGRPFGSVLRTHLLNPLTLARTESALREKLGALGGLARQFAERSAFTPARLVDHYAPLIEAGIQYPIPVLTRYDDIETLELLASAVLPALPVPAA